MRLRALSTTLRSLRARPAAAIGVVAHVGAPCCSAAPSQRRLSSSSRPAAAAPKPGANHQRRPLSLRPPPFAASASASASAAAASPPPFSSSSSSSSSAPVDVEVDVRIDGSPLIDGFDALREAPSGAELEALVGQLEADAAAAAAAALTYASSSMQQRQQQTPADRLSILSLVLCDDAVIAALNEEWRGVEGPTDVLSFPQSSSPLGGGDGGEEQGGGSLPWEVLSQFQQAGQNDYEDDDDDDDDDDEVDDGDEAGEQEASESTASALPPRVLGDLVLSLDTAQRQALERGHSLRTECRVLLVHGALHLLGYDHEGGEEPDSARDEEKAEGMARAERAILRELGWDGDGLIDAATKAGGRVGGSSSSFSAATSASSGPSSSESANKSSSSSSGGGGGGGSSSDSSGGSTRRSFSSSSSKFRQRPKARAVAIDLDGTLLTSSSRACLEGAAAAVAAADAGVAVIISTGKARPAAAAALEKIGLGGVLVGPERPGVFLQGLAAYGRQGRRVAGRAAAGGGGPSTPPAFPSLPPAVVRAAFAFAARTPGVSAVAFTGDECFTLRLTADTDELHSVYHEPLPRVPEGGIEELLFGGGGGAGGAGLPPASSGVLKMLFVAEPAAIEAELKPYWRDLLSGRISSPSSPELAIPAGLASSMQAVANMLELVPAGVDKGLGLRAVLHDLGIDPADAVAVGDGGNDLPMMRAVGTPVAMGNAVAEVKGAARHVVGTNDECGVAEAIERFVL